MESFQTSNPQTVRKTAPTIARKDASANIVSQYGSVETMASSSGTNNAGPKDFGGGSLAGRMAPHSANSGGSGSSGGHSAVTQDRLLGYRAASAADDAVSNVFVASIPTREPTLKEINVAELNSGGGHSAVQAGYHTSISPVMENGGGIPEDLAHEAHAPGQGNTGRYIPPQQFQQQQQYQQQQYQQQQYQQQQQPQQQQQQQQQYQQQQYQQQDPHVSNFTGQELATQPQASPSQSRGGGAAGSPGGYSPNQYSRSPTQAQLVYRGETKTTRLRSEDVKLRQEGKGGKKQKVDGFNNKPSQSSRGAVWNEMGNLTVDPYDSRVNAERLKATRARNSQVVGSQGKKAGKGTKLREFKRLDTLAESAHVKREAKFLLEKERKYKQLTFMPDTKTIHRSHTKMAGGGGGDPAALEREFTWKPPKNFKVFDPTEFAQDRASKIASANMNRWKPEDWCQVPDGCFKPTRDIGECD